jgi:hypothetical protein
MHAQSVPCCLLNELIIYQTWKGMLVKPIIRYADVGANCVAGDGVSDVGVSVGI